MSDNTCTVTERRVTPAAIAAWLHAQGPEPSTHVLAWFKHKGVAWPPVIASGAVAAPAAGPAGLRAEDVQDFAGLVQYRMPFNVLPPQRRPEWLPEHVAILRDAVNVPGSGGKAGAGRLLGMSGTGVGEVLKRHPESAPAKASPFPVPRPTSKAA